MHVPNEKELMSATKAARTFLICVIVSISGGVLTASAGATVPGQNGKLLLSRDVYRGDIDLFLTDPISGRSTGIPASANSPFGALSPSGKDIAYVQSPAYELWTKALSDSEDGKHLTSSDGTCCSVTSPVFSPDNRSILYSSFNDASEISRLEEIPVDGGEATLLGSWHSNGLQPDLSPDGTLVAFSIRHYGPCSVQCPTEVDLIDRDGSGFRKLDTPGLFADSPSFSPDGSRIAFRGRDESDPYAPSQIYSIRLNGSNLRQMSSHSEGASSPVYSPDGTKIAYTTGTSINFAHTRVQVADVIGEGVRTLPHSTGRVTADWQRKAPFVIGNTMVNDRKIRVKVFGPGRLSLSGRGIRTVNRTTTAGSVEKFAIRPNRRLRKRLKNSRLPIVFKYRVRFAPEGGLPSAVRDHILLIGRGVLER